MIKLCTRYRRTETVFDKYEKHRIQLTEKNQSSCGQSVMIPLLNMELICLVLTMLLTRCITEQVCKKTFTKQHPVCVCYTYANLLIGIWHKTLTSLVPVDVIQNYSNQQLHFLHTNVTVAWRLVSCCSAMHVGVEQVCLRLALQAFFGQVLPRP